MSVDATMILQEPPVVPESDRFIFDPPPLTMEGMFFPLGFPLLVRTNSEEVLQHCAKKWGNFEPRSQDTPIEADIYVIESDSQKCPPAAKCHFMDNTLVMVADDDNVCTVDFPYGKTRMTVTTAAVRHPHYFNQTFLEAAAACQLSTRFVTGIHAACVVLDGRGVMLCGDSGAGKTTLSWSCARAGWQFVADDTSFLLHGESTRRVIGNYHQVRFRPASVEFFPEIADAKMTPRMSGKPSVEMRTTSMGHVQTTDSANVDFVVFLNRNHPGPVDLIPYSKDKARHYMRKVLFGTPETKVHRYAAIERLLTSQVLELRYQSLHEAVGRLERLVREGR
jgi:hypothetical protein